MKYYRVNLFIISMIFCFGLIQAEIPHNTERLAFLYGMQDQTEKDTDSTVAGSNALAKRSNYRYPGRAMVFSGLVPGLGQLYCGSWKKALLFAGTEIAAWMVYANYEIKGDDETINYENYANEHWEFGKWVSDFYHWKVPFLDWDSTSVIDQQYHSLFADTAGVYSEIYDGSHYIQFKFTDVNNDQYADEHDGKYPEIVSNTNDEEIFWDYLFSGKTAEQITEMMNDSLGQNFQIMKDHTYYENIGKYNHFFAGWDDVSEPFDDLNNNGIWDEGETFEDTNGNLVWDEKLISIETVGGYLIPENEFKNTYSKMRKDANDFKNIAGYAVSAVMFNHVISMVDAVFTTRTWNNKHALKLSARTLYDPANEFGLGGVEVSISW